MTRRILFVNPFYAPEWTDELKQYLDDHKNPDTETAVAMLERGPRHVEFHYYESLVGQDVLTMVKQGEKAGFDGAILGCFYDPFLREAREICDHMVVTGLEEASLQLAASLGANFSIISVRQKCTPAFRENVQKYGMSHRLASFRHLNLTVEDLKNNRKLTEERMEAAIAAAVQKDGAEVVILGCSMMLGFYRLMQEKYGVPVIDPILAGFKQAEHLVEVRDQCGWYTSKAAHYETPPLEDIKAWNLTTTYGLPDIW